MKKAIIIAVLVVAVLSLTGGMALAGGWTDVKYGTSAANTHDPNNTVNPDTAGTEKAIWNPDGAADGFAVEEGDSKTSPHGGFSTATNRCRVCHAVHLAGTGSWRLLANGVSSTSVSASYGVSRETECNYCHGTDGVTKKRPYRATAGTWRGEHTLLATTIPDSGGETLGGGLSCNNCHSVHGGDDSIVWQTAEVGSWGNKILRKNPDGNGSDTSSVGFANDGSIWGNRSDFCADCHDENPNWDPSDDGGEVARPNKSSHVQGPAADGSLEINAAQKRVANYTDNTFGDTVNSSDTTTGLESDAKEGCRSCHRASDVGNVATVAGAGLNGADPDPTFTNSAFPHRSTGTKLLYDGFNGDSDATQSPTRVTENMDQVCAKCHLNNETMSSATEGVGKSF